MISLFSRISIFSRKIHIEKVLSYRLMKYVENKRKSCHLRTHTHTKQTIRKCLRLFKAHTSNSEYHDLFAWTLGTLSTFLMAPSCQQTIFSFSHTRFFGHAQALSEVAAEWRKKMNYCRWNARYVCYVFYCPWFEALWWINWCKKWTRAVPNALLFELMDRRECQPKYKITASWLDLPFGDMWQIAWWAKSCDKLLFTTKYRPDMNLLRICGLQGVPISRSE